MAVLQRHRQRRALLLLHVSAAALLFISRCHCSTIEDIGTITTSKGLAAAMYRDMKGTGGCYKLLNATGPVGSQGAPDALQDIDAPLVHYDQLQGQLPLTRDVAVLVPVKQSVAFMQQLAADAALQQHVKGVLIDDSDPPSSYSSVGPFPLSEYAPYSNKAWPWNRAAGANAYPSSSSWLSAPAFLLTPELAADARQRAAYNAGQSPRRKQYHARMKLAMTAMSINSSACIADASCKPLGGYSVWAALPPLAPPSELPDRQPIVLVVAQMDSSDMFHDSVQGADAPLSGLVAMLGALKVLQAAAAADGGAAGSSYSKRIVFLALAGEPWGYMGSRRLLFEATTGSNNTAGLEMALVEQVIEVGQVGRLPPISPANPAPALFAHSQRDEDFGDASSIMAALTAASQAEAQEAQLAVREADPGNPGIPPSSLMSFLRVNSSIQGLVLAEFDAGFTNPFYASRFDNGSTLNVDGVAATAAVLGAALHRLAGGDPATLRLNMTDVRQAVAAYASCIIMPVPGYACPLATSLMAPDFAFNAATKERSYAPRQYLGVLQYLPEVQGPLGKGNLARLLWNVLALGTRSGGPGAACDPFDKRCPAGQVCATWRGRDSPGNCVNATVRYVPSFSTRLACDACDDWWGVRWRPSQDADAFNELYGWPPDPVWAESDWPAGVPALQLYLHEARSVEVAVLVAGLLVTAGVAAASWVAKDAFERHHKSS